MAHCDFTINTDKASDLAAYRFVFFGLALGFFFFLDFIVCFADRSVKVFYIFRFVLFAKPHIVFVFENCR